MAKKHVVIAAVAGGVALTIAGGVAVAMALHKNDVTLSVDGESHNLSVREDTVQQVLEKDGITVGEHDVVAPSLETKVTNGMEISVLYGRQLQLTVDGEARTVWTTARTVDDALTQLDLNDPDSKLSASRSAAIGREGLSFNISTPKNVTIDAAGTPVELRVAGTVGDALTAAQVTPDEDDVVTPAAVPGLERMDGVSRLHSQAEPRGRRTTLLAEAAALPAVLSAIAAARPLQVAVRPPSLEQLFLDQYTEQEADDGGEPR